MKTIVVIAGIFSSRNSLRGLSDEHEIYARAVEAQRHSD